MKTTDIVDSSSNYVHNVFMGMSSKMEIVFVNSVLVNG